MTDCELEVWLVDLRRSTAALLALESEMPRLTGDDRARAAGRGERIATYVALRLVLEHTFGTRLCGRPISRAAAGRPALDGLGGDFSLSHVSGAALIATLRGGHAGIFRVGVDLERPREIRMTDSRRQRIEAAAEWIGADGGMDGTGVGPPLPEAGPQRFLVAWVRLEAYVKARGTTMARMLTAAGAVGGDPPSSAAAFRLRLSALGVGAAESQDADLQHGSSKSPVHTADLPPSGSPEFSSRVAPARVVRASVFDLELTPPLLGACVVCRGDIPARSAGDETAPLASAPRVRLLPDDLASLRGLTGDGRTE